MKIKKVKKEQARVTTLYTANLIDNLNRNVEIEFRYNRTLKKVMPKDLFIDGKSHGAKLRFFLDQNGWSAYRTDQFLFQIRRKIDEKYRKKVA